MKYERTTAIDYGEETCGHKQKTAKTNAPVTLTGALIPQQNPMCNKKHKSRQ